MMATGMLWLDADAHRSLEEKVRRAAEYYRRKRGQAPATCYVSSKSLEGKAGLAVDGIRVLPSACIPASHFLLGESGG